MGESGAAPLGGTDIETVRRCIGTGTPLPGFSEALEALSRIERVVEAAKARVTTEYGPCGCGACHDLREALRALDE